METEGPFALPLCRETNGVLKALRDMLFPAQERTIKT